MAIKAPMKGCVKMSDEEIVRRIQDRDSQAFHELYDNYFDFAYRAAKVVMNSQQSYAKDAVQETFIRVYQHIHLFDCNRTFKPWFYKILLNECNRILKKNSGVLSVGMDINHSVQQNEQTNDKLNHFVEYENLYKAIQHLDENNRIPIILKYLSGFKEQEIAEILGENINTIKSRLFYGRKKLKHFLHCNEEGS